MITLAEFVEQYGSPGYRVADLLARGCVVDPCWCGDDLCEGWSIQPAAFRHRSLQGKPPALGSLPTPGAVDDDRTLG